MPEFVLRLYVSGRSARSALAVANLERLCEQHPDRRWQIQIIDVLEWPDLAEQERIIATPTLVKELPPPLRRIIGDISDANSVLAVLGPQPVIPARNGGNGHE
ncbi:MAG: circadian clock KaiB family protein [Nevskia sp.]|nr:circadian clock KaiB family protein [Nevskia sp.]